MKPFLVGKSISIRHFTKGDVLPYLELANDIATMGEYWPLNDIRTQEVMFSLVSDGGYFGKDGGRVLITDHSDRIVGVLVFFKPVSHLKGLEMGYRIFQPSDQGKGYATEAVRLFSSFLFEYMELTRLQILTDPDNKAANGVARAAGFIHEGCLRKLAFCRGETRDRNIYSLLANEAPSLASLLKS